MITHIEIKGFQNHTDTSIDLSSGVNIIAGPSDNGKSAIVRALRWVFTNKPQGDSFIQNGADICSVTLTTDDGHVIIRRRSKKENIYILDGIEFKAMRGGVPDEIIEVLDIGPANLQSQHDPYYLLTMSSGDVARHLNTIAGLTAIDTSTKRANSLILDSNMKIKSYANAIEECSAALDEYSNLESVTGVINRIDRAYKTQIKNMEVIKGITTTQDTIHKHRASLLVINARLAGRKELEDFGKAVFKYNESLRPVAELDKSIKDCAEDIEVLNKLGDTEEKADILLELRLSISYWQSERKQVQTLMQYCSDLDKACREVNNLNDMMQADQSTVAKLRGDLKVCPTCGAIMGTCRD